MNVSLGQLEKPIPRERCEGATFPTWIARAPTSRRRPAPSACLPQGRTATGVPVRVRGQLTKRLYLARRCLSLVRVSETERPPPEKPNRAKLLQRNRSEVLRRARREVDPSVQLADPVGMGTKLGPY